MRGATVLLIISTPLWVCTLAATAQSYPERPIRLIVPFAPGGANDIIGRLVASKLHEAWGQPVVVDNRGGANAIIGTDLVARAPADGYTLLMVNMNLVTNPALVRKLPYDALKDLSAVALLATSPTVLVAAPSPPIGSVRELIAYAQAHPGKLSFGTSGVGTTTHMPMELLIAMTGIKMVAVHYKGGGPMLVDLIAGRVTPAFNTILSVMPHVQVQRLRALAVSTAKRTPALPHVPTVAESGVPGYEFTGWWGLAAPARTPGSVVAKLNIELGRILARKDVRDGLVEQGADPEHSTPEHFAAYLRAELDKWDKIIKGAGIQAEQ